MKLYELMSVFSVMTKYFELPIESVVITPDNKVVFDGLMEKETVLHEYAHMEVLDMAMELKYNTCVIHLK